MRHGKRILIKPNALDQIHTILKLLETPPVGLMTDIDGTIAEITDSPLDSVVSKSCINSLSKLTSSMSLVAFITGRSIADARSIINIDDTVLIGNHGLEILKAGVIETSEEALQYQPILLRVLEILEHRLTVPGIKIENKTISASIHYRLADDTELAKQILTDALAEIPETQNLRIGHGKMIIELLPPAPVNKGTSLIHMVNEYKLNGLVCLGDDSTDIEAFRALHGLSSRDEFNGLAIGVQGANCPYELVDESDFLLDDIPQVEQFLARIGEHIT